MPDKRHKGQAFERAVAVAFSLWLTNGARDDVLWRTSGSGARATTRRKRGLKTEGQGGDLTYTDPVAKPFIDLFSVECKSYADLRLLDVLDGKNRKSDLRPHWAKTVRDATATGRRPLLVFKAKRLGEYVFMRPPVFEAFFGDGRFDHPHVRIHVTPGTVRIDGKEKYVMVADDVVGVPLRAFLDAAVADAIKALAAVRAS